MTLLARICLAMILGAMLGCGSAPSQASTPQHQAVPASEPELVAFASDEGLLRLAHASAKVGFAPLANQCEAQLNGAFCGPTSAAIVLNVVRNRGADLPRDHDRLRPDDLRNLPAGAESGPHRSAQAIQAHHTHMVA